MIKKLIVLIGLLYSLTSCVTQKTSILPAERIYVNLETENTIYRSAETSGNKRVSKREAEESACNNARTEIAKNVTSQVIARDRNTIEYKNETLEQSLTFDTLVLTNANISDAKIENLECRITTQEPLIGKTETEYSCKCKVSIPKKEYTRLIEEEIRYRVTKSQTVKVVDPVTRNHLFYIDRFEVTEGEITSDLRTKGKKNYKAKCKNGSNWTNYELNSNDDKDIRSKKPMICLDKKTALEYCKSLGKDLPSKEEWEFAAGIFDNRVYPWGDEVPKANFGNPYLIGPSDIGSFPSDVSPFGVYDLAGNVAELTNTIGPKGKNITKGGSWDLPKEHMKLKNYNIAAYPSTSIGFRCILRP